MNASGLWPLVVAATGAALSLVMAMMWSHAAHAQTRHSSFLLGYGIHAGSLALRKRWSGVGTIAGRVVAGEAIHIGTCSLLTHTGSAQAVCRERSRHRKVRGVSGSGTFASRGQLVTDVAGMNQTRQDMRDSPFRSA
jgi:hypothetical protein